MQQYEKKGGHLIFLEDRIRPYEKLDGTGLRQSYANWDGERIGEVGKVGQWQDYIDETVKAQGYYYTNTNGKIVIIGDETASGALGFKLYNDDTNELLTFSNGVESMKSDNWASMTIPMSALGAKLRVVAAQADGTDVELMDIAESDSDEMQIEVLNAALAKAKNMMSKKTTDGRNIGYYYADALATLETLYNDAKAAADNQDTSVHSYKEWAALLNAEMERLSNDLNARAYLKNLDVYRIINAKEKAYQLCYDKYGLKANKQSQTAITSDDKKWMFESTGELHHYYIKNKNGLYLNAYEVGVGTSCSGTDSSTAVAFKANYLDDGRIYFSSKEDGTYLTLNSDYNVVCTTDLLDNSMWTIVRLEANNTGIEEVTCEDGNTNTIYDLQGRKIENPTKGIYIINGKKVFVK